MLSIVRSFSGGTSTCEGSMLCGDLRRDYGYDLEGFREIAFILKYRFDYNDAEQLGLSMMIN